MAAGSGRYNPYYRLIPADKKRAARLFFIRPIGVRTLRCFHAAAKLITHRSFKRTAFARIADISSSLAARRQTLARFACRTIQRIAESFLKVLTYIIRTSVIDLTRRRVLADTILITD